MRRFAQLVKEGKMPQAEFDKIKAETPNETDLPERAHPPKVRTAKKVKTI